MGKSKDILILSSLFKDYYGFDPSGIEILAGAGSARRYYRLKYENGSCIGVGGDNLRDCRAFLALDKVFLKNNISVPCVFTKSADNMYYLQSDLGNKSLFDYIKTGEEVGELIKRILKELVNLQTIPVKEWEKKVGYPEFNYRQVMWDLNYFKYEYLKPGGFDFDEEALEDDFEALAAEILKDSRNHSGFMYRDFQSRNVMIDGGKPYFIDFQGGRKGPVIYDAVSFLWQAKAQFSNEFRREMLDYYANELIGEDKEKKESLLNSVRPFVLFRTLQVLGAYGLRGLVEKKAHFIESIPGALKNLSELVDAGVLDTFPELKAVSKLIIADPRFSPKRKNEGHLTISVFSFSYKKGYPEDYSGNGGGFMFDCRGMHNPGRYEEYKKLTGRDKPVIDFLEKKGEVQIFCDKVFDLISPTIERYIKRGFTSLQLGFGCTGGQHRSVYCAERVGHILAERFPESKVIITHREQRIKEEL